MNFDRRTALKAAVVMPGLTLMHGSVEHATSKIKIKNIVAGVTPFIASHY